MKAFRYIQNGTSLSLDAQACIGCGICVEVCPHAVFGLQSAQPGAKGGGKVAILDRGLCMECGACARNCPAGALSVKAGVGCAAAIINGKLRGTAPDCGCGGTESGKSGSKRSCC